MVGVPMLKAERISRSGPKLSDAQTRNFEAIKYTMSKEGRGTNNAACKGFFGRMKNNDNGNRAIDEGYRRKCA